jgi:hypothetical protein
MIAKLESGKARNYELLTLVRISRPRRGPMLRVTFEPLWEGEGEEEARGGVTDVLLSVIRCFPSAGSMACTAAAHRRCPTS